MRRYGRGTLAPAVAVVGAWSVGLAVGRVWLGGGVRRQAVGALPAWPVSASDPAPAVVVGEVHHPVAERESPSPEWLVIPERGLYTGMLICGAIGSGRTSACMRPFARQLLGWQAQDRRRRVAGLVLEVKGDFCHDVRRMLDEVGRGDDYIELGIGGRWQCTAKSSPAWGRRQLADPFLVRVAARRQQSHDRPNRDAKAPNGRASSHHVRIQRDSIESGHGSSIRVA